MISSDSLLENDGVQRMSRDILFPLSVLDFFGEVPNSRANEVRLICFVNNSHSFEHGFVLFPREPKVRPGAGVPIFLFSWHCGVSFRGVSSPIYGQRAYHSKCVRTRQPPILKNLHQPIRSSFGIIHTTPR